MESGAVAEQPRLRRVLGPGLLLLFILGDILGTGVYALIGDVAAEVGGAAWVAFLLAFLIAAVTALSYLELVTKYPQAAGAALYAQKAFGNQFVTFLVAFVVMCAAITSASTASRFFAANFVVAFHFGWGTVGVTAIALLFMAVLAAVNLRGVGESVRLNVVLSAIEITGLCMVIFAGLWAFGSQHVDYSRVMAFDTGGNKSIFVALTTATSLAFFAMTGFEDSVNMAEETKNPVRVFPRVLLAGLSIAAAVYIVVAIVSVALVPIGALKASDTPLIDVVRLGAPGLPIKDVLPFISMVAVSNTALISMLMASRLIYGMSRQRVLPPVLGAVSRARRAPWVAILFTTAIAFAVILYVTAFANTDAIEVLGGTTSLLLLAVFTMVNVAVLVLRRDVRAGRRHFRTPTPLPVIGCVASLYLVTPLSGRPGQQYLLAAILVASGVVLSLLTLVLKRRLGERAGGITDAAHLGDAPG
ncbi:APC family permease [Mycobacterium kyorinense]|uniref:Amino acid permease n=1 Tax=Mycobacterium kyorinense TaxID=487514 RepID=A0A1X1Y000_9MYCO|nr:APC family permease [Mycobacterium kyorinense]ORW04425.1 amino acid permease [Mycobacterium kyorinense]